jgi:hypothetical protein
MKEKNGKTLVIVILVILLLGALGFITYDKLLKEKKDCNCPTCDNSKEKDCNCPTCDNNEGKTDYQKISNEIFYNDLLKTYLDHFENLVYEDINSFTNEKIQEYLFFFYTDYANRYELCKYNEDGTITYNVSKKEVDAIVLKTFGKKDYKVVNENGRDGIKKIDDNTYQVYYFATESYPTIYKFKSSTENDNFTTVEYIIYSNPSAGDGEGELGTAKFYLSTIDGNYYINKINFIKE